MRGYAARRDKNARLLRLRREEVYSRIPSFREIDEEIPAAVLDALKKKLGAGVPAEDSPEFASARQKVSSAYEKKRLLLTENGFPADYLDPVYDCPDCRDTGYKDGDMHGEKCHCLRQLELNELYDQSRLKLLIRTNNFDLLSDEYYEGESRQLFKNALTNCMTFLRTFDEEAPNLLFYGPTGTGKSFLSICVAAEILKRGNTVLYFSAADLLERISGYTTDQAEKQQVAGLMRELSDTELLVLDDLGTEMAGGYTQTALYTLIDSRLNDRPLVFSFRNIVFYFFYTALCFAASKVIAHLFNLILHSRIVLV